jgi:hypothetical protein
MIVAGFDASLLLDAPGLIRLAGASDLPITMPESSLPGIAHDIATVLIRYGSPEMQQPTLGSVVQRGTDVREHAQQLLNLLRADSRGPDGTMPPYVPVPEWLIADPARRVPGIGLEITLSTGESRGDAARDAMMAEAGIRIDDPSLFGAHDVARVAVAALRQLDSLAETAAMHAASIRRTSYKPAIRELFAGLARLFERLYPEQIYSVITRARPNVSIQERASRPEGPAMRWTLGLFKHAADAATAADIVCAEALRDLANHYQARPDGLARRILATRQKAKTKMHFYRAGRTSVKNNESKR